MIANSSLSAPGVREKRAIATPIAGGANRFPRPLDPWRGAVKIVGFFLFVTALAFALHAVVNHGLRQIPTSKFGAFNAIAQGRVNAEIVINGSSRALNHYDSRIIQKGTGHTTYNIGMNASQIDLQHAVLKTYLKHNRRPELVIQNLDLFSFETTQKGEIYDPAYYVPYLSENELYDFLRTIDPGVWKWKHLPLYGYTVEDMRFTWASGILACFGFYGPQDYFLGFNPRYQQWTEDFSNFRDANVQGVTYRIEPRGVQALEGIIQTCRSNDISIVLVYSPEYHEMQALERNRVEIFTRYQELCQRFQVPFWDYSNSELSRKRAFFYNSQHLNAEGAAAFSKVLAQKLVDTGLAQQP